MKKNIVIGIIIAILVLFFPYGWLAFLLAVIFFTGKRIFKKISEVKNE